MVSQPMSTASHTIYCSSCGLANLSWRSTCEQCKTPLASAGKTTYTHAQDRPGCLTAYALLLGISTGLLFLLGIGLGVATIASGDGEDSLMALGSSILGGFGLAVAIGLWRQKIGRASSS